MKLFTKYSTVQYPVTLDTAWQFLSNPKNLNSMTPPDMQFVTLSGDDRNIFPGQIIEYTIKPFWGISLSWVTEITHVQHQQYFVDQQRFGPYAFWHHKHFVTEIDGGVEITDVIHYKLPLGIIGRLLHPYLVEPKLTHIFEFRQRRLAELFGQFPTVL